MWRALRVAAAALLVAGYLLAALGLLHQRQAYHMSVVQVPLVPSDIFVPWYGAKALLRGVNPYTAEFGAALHLAFYGAIRQPTPEMPNVAAFGYPPYVVVTLAPFLWLPFEAVRWLSTVLLAVCLAGSALLWLRLLVPSPTARAWQTRAAVAGFAVAFFPSLELVWLQQVTGFVILYLVGAHFLAARGRLLLAGLLLALAMVKPQLAALPAAGLLFWGVCQRDRWTLPLGFGAGCLALAALSELLLPHWLPAFMAANARYQSLNQSLFWLPQRLAGSTLAGAVFIAAPLLALSCLAWWSARLGAAGSGPALRAMALTCAVAATLVPDVSFYNRAILIIPVLAVLMVRPAVGPFARASRHLALLGLAAPVALLAAVAGLQLVGVAPEMVQGPLDAAESAYVILPVLLVPATVAGVFGRAATAHGLSGTATRSLRARAIALVGGI